jgi:hypothetical protein
MSIGSLEDCLSPLEGQNDALAPKMIVIHGVFGSGKSFFMNSVCDHLNAMAPVGRDGNSRIKIVRGHAATLDSRVTQFSVWKLFFGEIVSIIASSYLGAAFISQSSNDFFNPDSQFYLSSIVLSKLLELLPPNLRSYLPLLKHFDFPGTTVIQDNEESSKLSYAVKLSKCIELLCGMVNIACDVLLRLPGGQLVISM